MSNEMPDDLWNCVGGSWAPTIGDPSIMGWITVSCYAGAAMLSGFVLLRRTTNIRIFWHLLTFSLVALAINKQLDLQSALTATGRCMAELQGWYGYRRVVQIAFIVILSVVSITLTLVIAWKLKPEFWRNWGAFFGFGILVTFVVIRAAGFHGFDQLIDVKIAGARMNWILELTGIVMIAVNAAFLIKTKRGEIGKPIVHK